MNKRVTQAKQNRERKKREHAEFKEEKKRAQRGLKEERLRVKETGIDPDLVGIIPGPHNNFVRDALN